MCCFLQLLSSEQDLTTKRNAFQVLCKYAQPKALNYLMSHIDSVSMWGDILQMAALELIRKVRSTAKFRQACSTMEGNKGLSLIWTEVPQGFHNWSLSAIGRACFVCLDPDCWFSIIPAADYIIAAALQVCRSSPSEKGNHIKIILALLQSSSTAVVYECAVTLVSLSQTPTAIRAAANCYAQMLTNQSDSNVKLIVLERLEVRHLLLTDQPSRHSAWVLTQQEQ